MEFVDCQDVFIEYQYNPSCKTTHMEPAAQAKNAEQACAEV